jgi:hypothetical protein
MSAGSARELTEVCRLLLIDADVESSELTTREIADTDRLERIIKTRVGPLFSRYHDLLTSYLKVKLLTTEGAEVENFLLNTVDDFIARDVTHEVEEPADSIPKSSDKKKKEKEQYSFEELRAAIDLVVRNENQPREDRQRRRRILVEQLAAGARRDGSEVSVPLKSILDLDPDVLDVGTEEAAYVRECRALVRRQRKSGFYPALAAYDPRARALVALEPRFRAFLRTDAGDISTLQQIIPVPVDQYYQGYNPYFVKDEIINAARLNHWRTQHPSE